MLHLCKSQQNKCVFAHKVVRINVGILKNETICNTKINRLEKPTRPQAIDN